MRCNFRPHRTPEPGWTQQKESREALVIQTAHSRNCQGASRAAHGEGESYNRRLRRQAGHSLQCPVCGGEVWLGIQAHKELQLSLTQKSSRLSRMITKIPELSCYVKTVIYKALRDLPCTSLRALETSGSVPCCTNVGSEA